MDKELEDIEYIPIVCDSVCELEYDVTEFTKGIKEGSYYAGLITSLINTGLDNNNVVEVFKIILDDKKFKPK